MSVIEALKIINASIRANPAQAATHYMKANCLMRLQRLPESISEYSLAERLAPGSQLAQYSRTARHGIDSMLAEQRGVAQSPEVEPKRNDSLPPGTLELIRKQAALARKRAVENGQAEAEGELAKARNEIKSLQEQAERNASRGRAGNEPVALSPAEIETIRSHAAANGEQVRELGRLKAGIKEMESQQKASEIQRQADNLEDQLVNDRPNQSREVKLNPVGTNLYIRNYSGVRPPIVPLHAQAKSMSDNGMVVEQTTSPSLRSVDATGKVRNTSANGKLVPSTARGQGQNEKRAVTSVKGEVVRN